MRGLFLKIFAIFWLAQSLIFIISTTMIVRQHFTGPNLAQEAFDSQMKSAGRLAAAAYEEGGCDGFARNTSRNEPAGAVLLTHSGDVLCSTPNTPQLGGRLHFPDHVDGRVVDGHNLWLIPAVSPRGVRYEYVWLQPPSTARRPSVFSILLRFSFPQLPVAIAVGGLTTLVLVLLFTRPLVRLRKAARALAAGDLQARVGESRSGPLRGNSDEFQGLVHDFNHMADRLESLVAAQRLLLRDVSHELRSPLSRLSVALELAREEAPPEHTDHLARIEREADLLNQLIGQLLTLSSMEARDRTSTFRTLSLSQLCEEMLPDAEYEAQRRPCTVTLQQDGKCSVLGDWELLYRAIENVVRNAIRYTAPETEVTIRVREISGSATVEVSDRGPGIPQAELEHIFRPFYRVDQARSTLTGGFGVGLAISERAVRLHSGTLQASNRPDGGTTMTFTFPIKKS